MSLEKTGDIFEPDYWPPEKAGQWIVFAFFPEIINYHNRFFAEEENLRFMGDMKTPHCFIAGDSMIQMPQPCGDVVCE